MPSTARSIKSQPEIDYYIAQARLGREAAVVHYLNMWLPTVDVYNPRFFRPNQWSNRSSSSRQSAFMFPRYLFVAATVPYQEIMRVPDLTLVIEGGPIKVPSRFISEMRSQEVDDHVVLAGVFQRITAMANHERAALLVSTFDKDWTKWRNWGDLVFKLRGNL